ncbi:hypothetical protein THARTR1_01407 [Trichoderma harzianum]|uniref:FAD dependent oxidoreductase domain-containing protein n=1 Tax=Trichoderma harzianum TaxID=5544 RepID=A0A2K0UMZ5_TRIHA|nr:hypothetical protein THARTR1_01407 [Trichoderma harzianum]
MSDEIYDVVVIGGGPIGLAAAYEAAKAGAKVVVLEQNNFFNHAGSSNDMARMFRTMYTEDYMADLAKEAMALWDDLEKDSGTPLRWMSGLLNFGDKDYGGDTPEGTLLGPIPNLDRLGMTYQELSAEEIQARYPFKNLDSKWIGLFAPDNGIIDVQLLLRTLYRLAQDYGATARQHTKVHAVKPSNHPHHAWDVHTVRHETEAAVFKAKKIIIASGAYVNHVLKPSFDISLDIDIWEMVSSYFNCNAGPKGTIFPSMWFQFAPDKDGRSQLFYGFPSLPWGPPNLARIAVDAATRRIKDPNERLRSTINPEDIADTQEFIHNHLVNVDATIPALTSSCLQTNVFDNMFVLDFVPEKYLNGGAKDSVVVFTAGWAMKFVPMLGKALADMALKGSSPYALKEFAITRTDPATGKGIIVEDGSENRSIKNSAFASTHQASGSSFAGLHNTAR